MVEIHPLQTGRLRMKVAQQEPGAAGLARVLFSRTWTPWLPILAWAIVHPEGVFVVDTGETAQATRKGYYPRWHPYYRTSLQLDLRPEDEIGPQLRRLSVDPAEDVRAVLLTHFHTDHVGGLGHFPSIRTLAAAESVRATQGLRGRLNGYLPHRLPAGFEPEPLSFGDGPLGPFARSQALTTDGVVRVVPTLGHAPGHVSVVVRAGGLSYFLAGDTSYTQTKLLKREADAVTSTPERMREAQRLVLDFAKQEPLVYLPSHDPHSVERLQTEAALVAGAG